MMANFRQAYDWDIRYRTIVGVHEAGSELLATDIQPGLFFDQDGLKIMAFDVESMPINVERGTHIFTEADVVDK